MILLTLIFSIIIHGVWFSELSLLTWGDWHSQSISTLQELYSLPYIWSTTSLGEVSIMLSFYPFQLLFGVFSKLNFSYGMIERILFMWPIVIGSVLFSYIFIKKNLNSTIPALIGSLVFSYNTYFMIMKTGHLTLLIAFISAPLVFLLFQKALEKKELFYIVLTALVAFIVSFYEVRAFYIIFWILFSYYLYFELIIEKKSNTLKNILIVSKIFGLIGLLNLYWILGFVNLGVLSTNELFSRQLFGNEFFDINYAITLFHPFWTGKQPTEFIVQPIPIHFWTVPIFAFLGLLLNRKNKIVIFFGFTALIGILLTKQVGQPFTELYEILYNYFPGFNAFRESSKFYFLIAFGYSFLISSFVDWIMKNWKKGRFLIYIKYALIVFIAFSFIWNAKPMITKEMGTLFVSRTIPNDYKKYESFLLTENTFYRTLWIPSTSRWGYYSNTHPQLSAILQLEGSWRDTLQSSSGRKQFSEGTSILKFFQNPEVNNVLDISSIKYVVVPVQDTENDDDFFRYYGVKRDKYINVLDKSKFLERKDIRASDLVVYQNTGYKPHIYLTTEMESVDRVVKHSVVNYQFINPTHYTLELSNVINPVYVNFSEGFHPQWKFHIGKFNWIDALIQTDYFVSDKLHTKNDANLNSYYVNPKELCAENDCVLNPDGTYTLEITLYFLPQSYVYIGGIISITTLLLIFGYLIFTMYEKKKHQ